MKNIVNITKLQLKEKFSYIYSWKKINILIFITVTLLSVVGLSILARLGLSYLLTHFLLNPPPNSILPVLLGLMGIIAIVFNIFNVINKIYFAKDKEMFASLPVNATEIYVSKLFSLFIIEFIQNSIIVLPIIIGYGLIVKSSLGYYLIIPLILLLFSLFNLLVAVLISIPITYFIKVMKKYYKTTTVLLIISAVFLFNTYMNLLSKIFISFNLVTESSQVANQIKEALASFANILLPYRMFSNLLRFENILVSLLVILSLIFVVGILVVIINYFNYESLSRIPKRKQKNYTYKNSSSENTILEIMLKNIKLIVRNGNEIFSYFLFTIIMPIFVYTYNRLLSILDLGRIGKELLIGANILLFVLLVLLQATYSASAISREGKNFYLLKITPSDFKKQAAATVLVNYILVLLSLIISSITIIVFGYLSISNVILIFILSNIFLLAHIFASYEYDLKEPYLDWYDSKDVSEGNYATKKSVKNGLIIGSIIGMMSMLVIPLTSYIFNYIVVFVIAIIYLFVKGYLLKQRMYYYFRLIEM